MRRLRYIPEGGALVEVTCRTVHSRFLLRPGLALNDIVVGVLARAQRKYPIRCCFFVFASNHFHLLLDVDDAQQLASFMRFLNSNLARELGRLVGWRDKIWARRYQAIVVSGEESAQIDRLRYGLSHGVKEGLVEKASEWPGVHCVRALVDGEAVEGTWFDRTQEYAARRRGEDFDRLRYATTEVLTLSPLPCWKDLPEETRKRLIAELVVEIETEAAARREQSGSQVLGVEAVLGQQPLDHPRRSKKSPAPLFHAATKAVRRELYEAYGWFVAAYREAAEKLRDGDRTVTFPLGSFPPALPFAAG
ncbi:MAG TPA: transposase [Thermoanaerobaculia bacterium]|nr:transposase [Thermoanaerobaculia bacterium]